MPYYIYLESLHGNTNVLQWYMDHPDATVELLFWDVKALPELNIGVEMGQLDVAAV